MHAYVGLTNWAWFQFLSAEPKLDEVNFWRPSNTRNFSLPPGAPFFFKLHQDQGGWIAGYGFFAGFSARQMWVAWEAFESKNGASSFESLHRMLATIRSRHGHESDPDGNYSIGCLMISEPTFFARSDYVRPPSDWPRTGLMGGKTIDISSGEGERIWMECRAKSAPSTANFIAEQAERYGRERLTRPRLGQGAFRLLVTDAYAGACAVSGEHSMPALEAAHIRPYGQGGQHEIPNGLLLRSDIHRLFDHGYVGVTPDLRFSVSKRLKDDYSNGRSYEAFDGQQIRLPVHGDDRPNRHWLEWHMDTRFKR